MLPWATFFPLVKNDKFSVDGPLRYNGHGVVLQNDAEVLELSIAMPAMPIAGLPIIEAHIRIVHFADGPGNELLISCDNLEIKDRDARIISGGATRRITTSLGGMGVDITRTAHNQATLTAMRHSFIITKKEP